MLKMMSLFNLEMAGGPENHYTLYDTHIPADLMALSGRLQSAEDRGEVEGLGNQYGFSECIGNAPMCDHGFFHFFPYTVPLLMDADGNSLPREGVQTGRMVLVNPISLSYWGGFTSGDEVTIHWQDDSPRGWKGPRAAKTIRRFADKDGGDDKVTCAGPQQAYNEFMEFVAGEGQ